MTVSIIQYIVSALIAALTGVAGWFVAREKNHQEIEKLRAEKGKLKIENFMDTFEAYKSIIEDNTQQIRRLTNEVDSLRNENAELRQTVVVLQAENEQLQKIISNIKG